MKLYTFEKIAGIQPSKGYLRNPKYQFEKIAAVATPYTTKVSKPSNKSNPTDMLPSNPQQPSITFGAGGSPMEGFLYPESPAAMAYRQKLDNRTQSQAIANARANIIGRATTQPVARKPNITRFEDLPQSSMKDKAFAYMDTLDQQGGSTSQGIRMPGFGNNNSFPSMYRPYVQPWQQQAPPLPQQPAPQSNFDLLASQPNPTNNIEIADSRIRNQGLLGQQRMDARNDALIRQQEQERARQQQALKQWGSLSQNQVNTYAPYVNTRTYTDKPLSVAEWNALPQAVRTQAIRNKVEAERQRKAESMTYTGGMENGKPKDQEAYNRAQNNYNNTYAAIESTIRTPSQVARWRANGFSDTQIDAYVKQQVDAAMERRYGSRVPTPADPKNNPNMVVHAVNPQTGYSALTDTKLSDGSPAPQPQAPKEPQVKWSPVTPPSPRPSDIAATPKVQGKSILESKPTPAPKPAPAPAPAQQEIKWTPVSEATSF